MENNNAFALTYDQMLYHLSALNAHIGSRLVPYAKEYMADQEDARWAVYKALHKCLALASVGYPSDLDTSAFLMHVISLHSDAYHDRYARERQNVLDATIPPRA